MAMTVEEVKQYIRRALEFHRIGPDEQFKVRDLPSMLEAYDLVEPLSDEDVVQVSIVVMAAVLRVQERRDFSMQVNQQLYSTGQLN